MDIKNERGMTLVEVLAVFVIGAVFLVIITQVLFFGIRAFDNTNVEAELRDEADMIMAHLVRELYVLKTSEIKEKHLPEEGMNNYYLELIDGTKIGFIDGEVYVRGEMLARNHAISIAPHGEGEEGTFIQEMEEGYYGIQLRLIERESEQSLRLQSEIAIIHDEEEWDSGGE